MKKTLLRTVILITILYSTVTLLSCKKSSNKILPAMWYVIYKKTTTGGVNELWSINYDGSNDHKINIQLPEGWQLLDKNMAKAANPFIYVLAYNATLNQNAIFECFKDGTGLKQGLLTPGAENLRLFGSVSTTTTAILYSRYNANKELELWQMKLDGSNHIKLDLVLPANTYFANDEQVASFSGNKSYVFLTTRFEDPITHNTTYPIYRCDEHGSNLLLVNAGETGSAPALQDAKFNGVLYSKSNQDISLNELWFMNIDGSDKHAINLKFPAGVHLESKEMAKLSDNGKTIMFLTKDDNGQYAIYSADIDGSKIKLLKRFTAGEAIAVQCYLQLYYI